MRARLATLGVGLVVLLVGSLVIGQAVDSAGAGETADVRTYVGSFDSGPNGVGPGAEGDQVLVGTVDVDASEQGVVCYATATLDNDSIWKGTDLIVGSFSAYAMAFDVELVKGDAIPIDVGGFLVTDVPVSIFVVLGTGERGDGTFADASYSSLKGSVTVTCETPPPFVPEPPTPAPECIEPSNTPPEVQCQAVECRREPCEVVPETPVKPATPITGTPRVTG